MFGFHAKRFLNAQHDGVETTSPRNHVKGILLVDKLFQFSLQNAKEATFDATGKKNRL